MVTASFAEDGPLRSPSLVMHLPKVNKNNDLVKFNLTMGAFKNKIKLFRDIYILSLCPHRTDVLVNIFVSILVSECILIPANKMLTFCT